MSGRTMPAADITRVQEWCVARSPSDVPVRVECQVDRLHLTIVEMRPPWDGSDGEWVPDAVARLRWTGTTGRWTLYWMDSNLRFRRYEWLAPSPGVSRLLDEVDEDPTALFWG